jgi:hypothetical protein
MSAAFTSGPWTARETPSDLDMSFTIDAGTIPVCDVYGGRDEDANARLIAAAPEIYEALESVPTPEREDIFEFADRVCKWVEAVRNPALAKARGDA